VERLPWRAGLGWPLLLFALFGGLGAAMLGSVAGAVFVRLILHRAPTGISFPEMLGQSAFTIAVLAGAAALWPPRGKLFAKLGIRPLNRTDIGIALLTCLGVVLIGGGLTEGWQFLLDRSGISYQKEQALLLALSGASIPAVIGIGIVVVIAVPMAEEIFFRRMLFGLFRPLGVWKAILLTAAVFAAVHLFLLGIPALFLMGIGFQLAYLYRRNLSSSILAHGLVNLCALIGTLLQAGGLQG